MKISSWNECREENNALTVTPDKAKTRSLKETALERIKFFKENIIKEENANFIFEGYYASAIELLHAIVLLEGFKVDNHICLGYYLRDILKKEELFRTFDDCRYKRNSLVYYGKKMDFTIAQETINKMKALIEQLEKEVESRLKKND